LAAAVSLLLLLLLLLLGSTTSVEGTRAFPAITSLLPSRACAEAGTEDVSGFRTSRACETAVVVVCEEAVSAVLIVPPAKEKKKEKTEEEEAEDWHAETILVRLVVMVLNSRIGRWVVEEMGSFVSNATIGFRRGLLIWRLTAVSVTIRSANAEGASCVGRAAMLMGCAWIQGANSG
jgi:hypothetical protein